jgi:DNA replication protein DnaC
MIGVVGSPDLPVRQADLRVSEQDLPDRERQAAKRRGKNARFPVIKTLETFDFERLPSINETLIRELPTGECLDRRENILLVANSRSCQVGTLIILPSV